MAERIDGIVYLENDEVAEKVGVARQTFWRWRRDGKVPQGQLYRGGKKKLFSPAEVAEIERFANRLEPIEPMLANQLGLFNRPTPRESS